MSDTVFTTTPAEETTTSFVEKLVTSKGETWKDPEVIARGKIEADNHIASLEAQIKELKEDLTEKSSTTEAAEALLEELKTKGAQTSDNKTQADTSPEVNIEELVFNTVNEIKGKETAEANLSKADSFMKTTFGDKAVEMLNKRAASLGMSVEDLKTTAAKSPEAFKALIAPQAASVSDINSSTGVNTDAQTDARGPDYFTQLRKEDPNYYYSLKGQNERMAAMNKNPELFEQGTNSWL